MATNDEVKELIADPRLRIKLHDYVWAKSSDTLSRLAKEESPVGGSFQGDEFALRLNRCEEIISELISTMALLGFWGTSDHAVSATLPVKLFSNPQESLSSAAWDSRREYPLILILYSFGIGATAADNYGLLHSFFQTTVKDPASRFPGVPFILSLDTRLSDLRKSFKSLPGRENQHTPLSEYLFDYSKEKLGTVLFTAGEHETIFDRFEILLALQHAHETDKTHPGRFSGPIGRFGWKYFGGDDANPFNQLQKEAARAQSAWPPLKSGFFDGDYERFKKVAAGYSQSLQSLRWY